ncbi:3-methyl-2-oxobutanoate hydroxymethyltransferase [Kocuria dechangensis]|uniref:3-methyl-2-oxobutanoate hydroxymethyltransferase n=1 Tax=Kocuria dechangensis TaxID=1176249 RepID=A0A917LY15_9MICC|nr:3-methyl-2-oxobutanoate hydroxymethyltransferase [Kocuria dechangensis]GGG63281.1 3-methyl-2-oxobutanoate hydroxymethyltransferase [Kocuria dechangensis]
MTQQPQDPPRPQPGALDVRRVRTHHLLEAKRRGERFTMLTSYDALTAAVFDAAGVDTLLVGDSAGNNVLGYPTTIPVTVDELLPLCRAVAGAAERALVVVDLPFGSYEASPEQAVGTAVRFLKEGGAHAVKLEGGAWFAPHVRAMTQAGVPVVGHLGFTPQSEHALGGYRVQGRGDAAQALVEDALALQEAGAFCVLMEMVPAETAAAVDAALEVPTIGIGAGAGTTGQVLVWQDMLGLRRGRMPRFVRQYADLHGVVTDAVGRYVADVREGRFPGPEHSF